MVSSLCCQYRFQTGHIIPNILFLLKRTPRNIPNLFFLNDLMRLVPKIKSFLTKISGLKFKCNNVLYRFHTSALFVEGNTKPQCRYVYCFPIMHTVIYISRLGSSLNTPKKVPIYIQVYVNKEDAFP